MTTDGTQGCVLPESLDQARIGSLPPAAYYIADFITEEEERHILEKVGCISGGVG